MSTTPPSPVLAFCEVCAAERPAAGAERRNADTLGPYWVCAACAAGTTLDTITAAQVRALASNAAEAGDEEMVATCALALCHFTSDPNDATALLALAECERAIRDAEAQR